MSPQSPTPTPKARALHRKYMEILIYLGPIILIVALFVFAPLAIMLFYSFLKSGPYGEIVYSFSLDNFRAILFGGYGKVLFRSLYLALQNNLLCILIGYPIAYYIARFGGRYKALILFLVVVPSWASYLIRLYAMKTIIGNKGIINGLLLHFNIIAEPMQILYTQGAVVAGLVYAWLPFMILPIHASLEGLNPAVLEAAADLGAPPWRRFFRVTLPLTRGGLLAGSILVFIPTVGEWLVPHVLGGSKILMAGSLVAEKFTATGNIPQGASLSFMLAAILILILYLTIKWGGREAMERMI